MTVHHTAYLYPGQGSQRVGMGAELLKHNPALFERYLTPADQASGRPISRLVLEGSMEALTDTRITQPALFALALALTEHSRSVGIAATVVAGHSLGEYTAAVAAGALDFDDGLRLVCERARLMAEAQLIRPGAMAMVAGLSTAHVARLCADGTAGVVTLANLNAPTQSVVSGDRAAVEQLAEQARAAGAAETLILNVEVAAHSAFMQPVADGLAPLIDRLRWTEPHTPLVANVSGVLLTSAADIRHALLAQLTRPVQWIGCIERLREMGVTRFIELGPGRVLSGLVRQILPGADAYASASPRRISALAPAVAQATSGRES